MAFGAERKTTQCKIGNFALPPSQQPGPLVSFGENIVNRNELILYLFGDAYIGKEKYFTDLLPGVVYGITDDLSLFFNIPVAPRDKLDAHHSSGLEDIFLQLEYAIFTRIGTCITDQVTIVGNASFPTGSSHKNPPTGFGAMGYFLGVTYDRTWAKWYWFTSYGVELPTSHHGTKFGNQYLYQAGLGKTFSNARGWIFSWMAEIDGTFYESNKIKGTTDSNSGGNVVYLTPSIWASSMDWILQLGLGYAVQQNLFGNQKRNEYLIVFNIGRTFW